MSTSIAGRPGIGEVRVSLVADSPPRFWPASVGDRPLPLQIKYAKLSSGGPPAAILPGALDVDGWLYKSNAMINTMTLVQRIVTKNTRAGLLTGISNSSSYQELLQKFPLCFHI